MHSANARLARGLSIPLGLMAFVGLVTSGHLFGLINTDAPLDVLRLITSFALGYAGYVSLKNRHIDAVLMVYGAISLVVVLFGLFSRDLFGVLPSGLTAIDLGIFVVSGGAAIWATTRQHDHELVHFPRM